MTTHRWNVNGRALVRRRMRAGLSAHDVAVRLRVEDRILVGIEKGYRGFESDGVAKNFLARYEEVCKAAEAILRPGLEVRR